MTAPLLSVVCFASPHRERTRRCLAALRGQTAAEKIELVLLDSGNPADRPDLPPTLAAVCEQLPAEASLGQARAIGVRAAREPPAVAFMSDHCYPEPGWAAALIEAYREPWAAVGYAFRDPPGATYGARAGRIADHSRWFAGLTTCGVVDSISYLEASYRRDFLDSFGDSLEWVLDSDFSLQSAVHAQGLRMAVAPEAVITHDNLATVRANGLLSYHSSRLVGARHLDDRKRGALRRALYALAAPVAVPLLRTLRLIRDTRGVVPAGRLAAALPAIVVKNVYEGVGQAHGYLRGEGEAAKRLMDAELRWPRSA
jgi:Glycosyl transferase family 2